MMMMEEDVIDDYSSPWEKAIREPTMKEKKADVKRLLENDTELLNEIVLDIRKDKINKIRNNK